MMNFPWYYKNLGESYFIAGFVSNGSFYWCETSHKEESYGRGAWLGYIGLFEEHFELVIKALVNGDSEVHIAEHDTKSMFSGIKRKMHIEITPDNIIFNEVTSSFSSPIGSDPKPRQVERTKEPFVIPLDLFCETIDFLRHGIVFRQPSAHFGYTGY